MKLHTLNIKLISEMTKAINSYWYIITMNEVYPFVQEQLPYLVRTISIKPLLEIPTILCINKDLIKSSLENGNEVFYDDNGNVYWDSKPIHFNDSTMVRLYLNNYINLYNNFHPYITGYNNIDIKSDLEHILTLKAEDKNETLNIDNKYLMTLHKTMLPVNKSDEVRLSIYDNNNSYFTSNFLINKKKFIVDLVILFKKI